MTLSLTLLAYLLVLAAVVLEFAGVDAPVHRRAQKRASRIEDRADRIGELGAALEDDYHARAERMTMGRVPDIRKDMAPRFATQKELAAPNAEAGRPEVWDRSSEGGPFRGDARQLHSESSVRSLDSWRFCLANMTKSPPKPQRHQPPVSERRLSPHVMWVDADRSQNIT